MYVLFAMPLTIGLGLLIALGLNQAVVRLRNALRTGYFLPFVTSMVAIAVVWRLILGTDAGLLNGLLERIGIDGPGWLTDPRWALWSMILMTTWHGLGLQMIVFLAGLQAIPNELYEAAAVDGATRWHKFRFVTMPMLRPTLLFSAVIASIGLVQVFEEPFVMTAGRAARRHAHRRLLRLQRVRLRQLRLHRGGQLHRVPRHRCGDLCAVQAAAPDDVSRR